MTSGRHERLARHFRALTALGPEERADYLDEACAHDETLRAELEQLLAHDSEDALAGAGEALAAGARELVSESDEGRLVAQPETIGGYRILGRIGAGGMGVVYEAEQDHPKRRVAVKVIRAGRANETTLARFQREAQVLGLLDHPSIARVYAAGADEGPHGTEPWFAMELVQGDPLTTSAERHGWSLEERLELVARVCDAIQHAHDKGVVHRDLKPGNVLVDATGRPRVLDFGVARALDPELHATGLRTHTGELIGTLAYMAPEQVSGPPDDIDARADVYALGVILYELVSGRRPHDVEGLGVHEAARIVVERDPPSLGQLDPRLRGDVEWIVAKAIEKDPARRYASAAALASDLRAHLADQPIQARPPSLSYQLRKFGRRNRALVAGVGGIFAALLLGLVVSTRLYLRAEDRRIDAERATETADRALAEEKRQKELAEETLARAVAAEAAAREAAERAERESGVSRAVTDYLITLFEHANPEDGAFEELTARQLLDRGAERIRTDLTEETAVRARLLNVFGKIYNWLQAYSVSGPILEEALVLTAEVHGEDSAEVADTLERLAHVRATSGAYEEARELQEQVLDIRRRRLGARHRLMTDALNNLANTHMSLGEYGRAEELLQDGLTLLRETFPEDSLDVSNLKTNLGTLLAASGRPNDAVPLLREAIAVTERELGKTHWRYIANANALADALRQSSRTREALPLAREAHESYRARFGLRSRATYDTATVYSSCLEVLGRNAEAAALLEELLPHYESTFGRDDGYLNLAANLASAWQELGENERAEELFDTLLEERLASYGEDHPETLTLMHNIGLLYLATERLEEAEALAQLTLELRSARLGPAHPDTHGTVNVLLAVYRAAERWDDLEATQREKLRMLEDVLGADHPRVAAARSALSNLLDELELRSR